METSLSPNNLQKGPIELSQDLMPPQVFHGEEASMLNSTQQGRRVKENSSKEQAVMPEVAEPLQSASRRTVSYE